jgi:hypothetical protein
VSDNGSLLTSRNSQTRTLTGAATTAASILFQWAFTSGQTYSFTTRIGRPALERSAVATSPVIATSGSFGYTALILNAFQTALSSAQSKVLASGVYKMAFNGSAKATSTIHGVLSNGAQLSGAGVAAAQAKLRGAILGVAPLAGKAAAQAKAQAAGIYTMAFSAKSATQAHMRGPFLTVVFLASTIAAQAKAKTGNTLQVILSARSSAQSFIRGAYSRGGFVASRFAAYFIS